MPTVTGRAANLLSNRLDPLARLTSRTHTKMYRATKGRYWKKFLRKPVILVDVVGRSSGQSRPVMLMRIGRDDDFVVCGSNGGNTTTPNWYRNLAVAGAAHVEVDGQRIEVSFREVADDEERAECWSLLTAGYPDFASYQELTERQLPIGLLERTS